MTRRLRGILKTGAMVIALALPFLLPAQALAETIVIVNDTKGTVVVQVATVIRGAVRRGAPTTLGPGEKTSITVLGNKLVNVYDARFPNKMLFQGTITASKDDGIYAIKQPDPRLPKVEVDMVKSGKMMPR
ncbi:MAG TPA: hypothetical protein VKA46_38560 [Gemmataceae bacterium]|nr:hypothetical protein [Gemmataceae bacterium]